MNFLRFVANALSIATTLSSMVGGAHAIPISQETRGNILYVKEGGTGDCSSWENACDLQDALGDAETGNEIWVAEGTYYPTDSTDRTVSFKLKNGVALYGGFAGTETARDQRDWVVNPTILSGDLGIAVNKRQQLPCGVRYGVGCHDYPGWFHHHCWKRGWSAQQLMAGGCTTPIAAPR